MKTGQKVTIPGEQPVAFDIGGGDKQIRFVKTSGLAAVPESMSRASSEEDGFYNLGKDPSKNQDLTDFQANEEDVEHVIKNAFARRLVPIHILVKPGSG